MFLMEVIEGKAVCLRLIKGLYHLFPSSSVLVVTENSQVRNFLIVKIHLYADDIVLYCVVQVATDNLPDMFVFPMLSYIIFFRHRIFLFITFYFFHSLDLVVLAQAVQTACLI